MSGLVLATLFDRTCFLARVDRVVEQNVKLVNVFRVGPKLLRPEVILGQLYVPDEIRRVADNHVQHPDRFGAILLLVEHNAFRRHVQLLVVPYFQCDVSNHRKVKICFHLKRLREHTTMGVLRCLTSVYAPATTLGTIRATPLPS